MFQRGFVKIVGIIFVIGAIWIAVKGVAAYRDQLDARDWCVWPAVVTNVASRIETSASGTHFMRKTVYDIDYEYNVYGDIYTGRIIGTVSSQRIGDIIDIKWDPDAPENSTDVLEPRPGALAVNLVGSCIFAVIGLYVAGLQELIAGRWKKRENGFIEGN